MSGSSEAITVEKRKRGRPKKQPNEGESETNDRLRITRQKYEEMSQVTLNTLMNVSVIRLKEEEQRVLLMMEILESKNGGKKRKNVCRGETRNKEIVQHYVDYCLASKAKYPDAILLGTGFMEFFNDKLRHENEAELKAAQHFRYMDTLLVCKHSSSIIVMIKLNM
jgi:hypothetical protein